MNPLDRREELNVRVFFCRIVCRCLMCRYRTLVRIVMAFYTVRRVAEALLYRYMPIRLLVNSELLQLPTGLGDRDRGHPLLIFPTLSI